MASLEQNADPRVWLGPAESWVDSTRKQTTPLLSEGKGYPVCIRTGM